MSTELMRRRIFTKIHLTGNLENKVTKERMTIDTNAIKTTNSISYQQAEELYKLKIVSPKKLILNRKNTAIDCTFYFEENKVIPAIYIIRENNISLEINIKTNYLKITNNNIIIKYTVIDSNEEYEYNIEMSDQG